MVKNAPGNGGDMGFIPQLGGSPGEGNDNPLQYSLPGQRSHGQRSLASYDLQDHKELDKTLEYRK